METGVQEYQQVFKVEDVSEDMQKQNVKKHWRQQFWQVFPSFCASSILIPFGIMLGWPSPIYPYLIQSTSVIPISLSQSAMIAGFLMLGVTIATPFSSKYHLGPKYGIWIGIILITTGWIVMWYSKNIFWLLGSRLTVGLGSGYGMGQVKSYIRDLCEPNLASLLLKQLNFHGFAGVIIAYITGVFLDFRKFPLVPGIFCLIVLIVVLFLPCTPKDLLRNNRPDEAVKLLNYLRGKRDHTSEINKIHNDLGKSKEKNFLKSIVFIMKEPELRMKFFKFIVLIFLQQFIGGPTTIIYCQIILINSGITLNQEYYAIFYSLVFFTSNIYGVFYSSTFNKKLILIISSVFSSLALAAEIFVLKFNINENYWHLTSFTILVSFMIFYSIGIGNIPVTYISEWFPGFEKVMSNIFLMEFCMMALIATKLFQVCFTKYSLIVGFSLFLISNFLFLIFVLLCIEKNRKSKNNGFTTTNTVYFWQPNILNEKEISPSKK